MKFLRVLPFIILLGFGAYPVIAHHPAADIVDADIYATIDEMVSDTPHATMVFDDDMGTGVTTTTIDGRVNDMIDLVDMELLSYIALLDGDVIVTMEFPQNRQATLTIVQEETVVPVRLDVMLEKSAALVDETTLESLKASYR